MKNTVVLAANGSLGSDADAAFQARASLKREKSSLDSSRRRKAPTTGATDTRHGSEQAHIKQELQKGQGADSKDCKPEWRA